jgi:Lipopolysaccharide assembly protein A domain
MTRLLLAILMILAAAALVAFAIANRTLVTVSFDPFDPTDPAFVATMPLYLLAFAILILGAIVGGLSASNQGKRRRERRRLEAELGRVRAELDRTKRDAALREVRGAPSPQATSPHASLPVARLPAN